MLTDINHCLQAYLLSEKENEAFNSDDSTFAFLHKLLNSAIKSENHQSKAFGFSTVETVVALNKLAANDLNKERIVKAGILPDYIRLLQDDCCIDEHRAVSQGLWTLAFRCRDDVAKEPGCIEGLNSFRHYN